MPSAVGAHKVEDRAATQVNVTNLVVQPGNPPLTPR
jgi:hypothetical protein